MKSKQTFQTQCRWLRNHSMFMRCFHKYLDGLARSHFLRNFTKWLHVKDEAQSPWENTFHHGKIANHSIDLSTPSSKKGEYTGWPKTRLLQRKLDCIHHFISFPRVEWDTVEGAGRLHISLEMDISQVTSHSYMTNPDHLAP